MSLVKAAAVLHRHNQYSLSMVKDEQASSAIDKNGSQYDSNQLYYNCKIYVNTEHAISQEHNQEYAG